MKLFITLSFSFLNFTKASLTSLQENIENYANSLNRTGRGSVQSRAFAGFVKESFAPISEYGCWCYLDKLGGKGEPIHLYDEACKQLQQSYANAIAENGNSCVPWLVDCSLLVFLVY